MSHPKLVASWEGFAIEQVLVAEPHDEAFFWATHHGADGRENHRGTPVRSASVAGVRRLDPGGEWWA